MSTKPPPITPLVAESLVVSFDGLDPPLVWEDVFERAAPTAVEIGTGNGFFIAHEAARHPEMNFLGIEQERAFFWKMTRRCARAGLTNVRTVTMDALELLDEWVPERSLARVYCYFSDPWPKRRHARRRVFGAHIPDLLARVLRDDGEVRFKTDVGWYFNLAVTAMRQSPDWRLTQIGRRPPPDPTRGEVVSNYERKAREAGREVWGFHARMSGMRNDETDGTNRTGPTGPIRPTRPTDSSAPPLRCALIFGGVSPEHEISILSAATLTQLGLAPLAERRPIEVQPVYITREGRWVFPQMAGGAAPPDATRIECAAQWAESDGVESLTFERALARLVERRTDVGLLSLHGLGGEDGHIQAALDRVGVAYTGSGAAASALALDKARCQEALRADGLPVPASIVLRVEDEGDGPALLDAARAIAPPCVVKPARGGSSVGVGIVHAPEQLAAALKAAFEVDKTVLVEEFVGGRELTCGLLAYQGELLALPVTEIIPPEGRFFDYDAKYSKGVSREVTPAAIPNALAERIQTLARRTHRACGCRGFSRVDFIADPGDPVVLEINTIPGMTATSLLPQAAATIGIAFPELIETMLETARHD